MRKVLVALAIVLLAALAAPFVVPTSAWLPKVAALAGKQLGQPVAIASLELHLVPTPRLVAKGIRVGRREAAKVGELEIVPALGSLFSGPTTLRLVRARHVELGEEALAIVERMPKGDGGGIEVRRVVLEHVRLSFPKLAIGEFDATVVPGPGNAVGLALSARQWQAPAVPLRFETLSLKGRLVGGSALELSRVEGKLYGGSLRGEARLAWGPKWQLAGKLAIDGTDLRELQRALGVAPRLTGRLRSDSSFQAQAPAASALRSALSVDGPFEVEGGVYRGIDLASVGDFTGSRGQGGATRFEQFKGVLALRGEHISIRELCVRSPQLVAAGSIEVAPDERLSGKLDVALAKAQRLTRVPVVLAGTTDDPVVRPTKGYLIGAAVGTLLMPGIGTGLGASAGRAFSGKATGCD